MTGKVAYSYLSPIIRVKDVDRIEEFCDIFNSHAKRTKGNFGAVVKSNAYGIGIDTLVPVLVRNGTERIFTSDLYEAASIRKCGFKKKLYTLSNADTYKFDVYDELDVTPTLCSKLEITEFMDYSIRQGKRKPAVLHFDSGMNRTGITGEEISWVRENIRNISNLIDVDFLMTHLHSVELDKAAEQERSIKQVCNFKNIINMMPCVPVSVLATHGTLFLDDGIVGGLDRRHISRIGVGLLGDIYDTKLAFNMYARICGVRVVEKGEGIGYDQIFHAREKMKVATLDLGYGDGYMRDLSVSDRDFDERRDEIPYVTIGNRKAEVVGKISMNMITVDVTDIPEENLSIGRYAEIVGENVDIRHLSDYAGTVIEELLINLNARNYRASDVVNSTKTGQHVILPGSHGL